jgi:hypothetical protein
VKDLAERQGLETLPLDTFSAPFSRGEKLFYHLALFIIGGSSLIILDAGGTPHHLWSWPWVAGWAVVLLIHGGWVLLVERRQRPAAVEGGYAPGAGANL